MVGGAGGGSRFALACVNFHQAETAERDTRGGCAVPVRHRVAGDSP